MALVTKAFNDMVSLPTVITLLNRHKNNEGFCEGCAQPWPCDVRILEGILIQELDE
jgi:hypothetical protein